MFEEIPYKCSYCKHFINFYSLENGFLSKSNVGKCNFCRSVEEMIDCNKYEEKKKEDVNLISVIKNELNYMKTKINYLLSILDDINK